MAIAKTKKAVKPSAKKTAEKKPAKAPAKKAVRVKKPIDETVLLKDAIVKSLDDGKAEDIKVIDLHGKSSMADFIIVTSGTSSRHIAALAENLHKKLKQEFKIKAVIEGKSGSDWVVIDALDIIVHIFHPEARDFYAIEEIWQ